MCAGSERRLLQAGEGVTSALELRWQELHGNLRTFIRRRVHNQADVDDLVQRVLLQIVTGLGSLRQVERLHAWVYRVLDGLNDVAARRGARGAQEERLAVSAQAS